MLPFVLVSVIVILYSEGLFYRKEQKEMKNKKKLLVLIPIVLVLALVAVFFRFKPQTTKGSKAIVINVKDDAGKVTEYSIRTDAEFLRQAMEDAESEGLTFSGDESEYGLMITTVNGVTADYDEDQSYWAFYVNDEYCQYGVDTQPVNDKDVFRIEYTK